MAKRKRKLTAAEKRARKKRRETTMMIFIARNADPLWLQEMWELAEESQI